MKSIKELENLESTYQNMQIIIESYEEIAANRMRRVKKSVLQNRDFLMGLNTIYRRVVYTYNKHAKRDQRHKDGRLLDILHTNGKTVSVLLSSNTSLYGAIVKKTFDYFMENILRTTSDIVIIGRLGKSMYDNYGYDRPYKYFELSDSGLTSDKLDPILSELLEYTHIALYHGIFRSVLTQDSTRTLITGDIVNLPSEEARSKELDCIIEPSVEEVAEFFEKQILASLFEHATYESSLSKFASRMVSLDVANDNIERLTKETKFKLLKQRHKEANAAQQNTLSSLSLWR
ncbi:F0F1 ATP synthase subunit gamma [bacterium]|nr:F0F1 ATP synthase subunit gamma [bacterium]